MEAEPYIETLNFVRSEVGNLNLLQASILIAVFADPGITQVDLGKMLRLDSGTVSRNLKRLSREGKKGYNLVERRRSQDKPNTQEIFPTAKGKKKQKKVFKKWFMLQ